MIVKHGEVLPYVGNDSEAVQRVFHVLNPPDRSVYLRGLSHLFICWTFLQACEYPRRSLNYSLYHNIFEGHLETATYAYTLYYNIGVAYGCECGRMDVCTLSSLQ